MSNSTQQTSSLHTKAGAQSGKSSKSSFHATDNESDDPAWATLVEDHIPTGGSLTADELAIWQHIQQQKTTIGPANEDLATASAPVDEAGYRQAISSLEASTRSLNAQADILEQQQILLKGIRDPEEIRKPHDANPEQRIAREQNVETQHLKFMNDELSSKLASHLCQAQQIVDKAIKNSSVAVTDQLRADDRAMQVVEQLSNSTTQGEAPDILSKQQHVDKLLTALEHAICLNVKERLNRIYLQELSASTSPGEAADEPELQQIQTDLQSLYAEIENVAAILVNHEHGARLKGFMQEIHVAQQHAIARNTATAGKMLESMTTCLHAWNVRLEFLHSYRTALQEMSGHLKVVVPERPSEIAIKSDNESMSNNPHITALQHHLGFDLHTAQETSDTTLQIESLVARLQDSFYASLESFQSMISNTVETSTQSLGRFDNTTRAEFSDEVSKIEALEQAVAVYKARVELVGTEHRQASFARGEIGSRLLGDKARTHVT